MKTLANITLLALLLGATASAAAQEASDDCVTHDRERGECSPGTEAPTRASLVNALESATPQDLMATLEYGEMVECYECVPALVDRILNDDNPQVREFSAWYLRKRMFAIGRAMRTFRTILASDGDAVRRSRAAEAIGEFLDPNGLVPLRDAAMGDTDAGVRASAVSALGRLNHPGGNQYIAAAFSDSVRDVRIAALRTVMTVNFFRQTDELIPLLADGEAEVRRETALLLGQHRVTDAVDALGALLRGDSDAGVRRAAAWALGRLGGSAANGYLSEASSTETDEQVQNAIEVAQLM